MLSMPDAIRRRRRRRSLRPFGAPMRSMLERMDAIMQVYPIPGPSAKEDSHGPPQTAFPHRHLVSRRLPHAVHRRFCHRPDDRL